MSAKQKQHIKGLALFSEACERVGIHPAQGLRLVHRHFSDTYALLKVRPTYMLALRLAQKVKNYVIRETASLVKQLPAAKPNHFVLNTLIPNNLNEIKGYNLPTHDVHPDIHFIRTQRRYNKRRYARVRAVSRPSFWAGMTLSTIMTGVFWGASLKMTNWCTTASLIPDVNQWILAGYLILLYRTIRLLGNCSIPYAREVNSVRPAWFKRFKRFKK